MVRSPPTQHSYPHAVTCRGTLLAVAAVVMTLGSMSAYASPTPGEAQAHREGQGDARGAAGAPADLGDDEDSFALSRSSYSAAKKASPASVDVEGDQSAAAEDPFSSAAFTLPAQQRTDGSSSAVSTSSPQQQQHAMKVLSTEVYHGAEADLARSTFGAGVTDANNQAAMLLRHYQNAAAGAAAAKAAGGAALPPGGVMVNAVDLGNFFNGGGGGGGGAMHLTMGPDGKLMVGGAVDLGALLGGLLGGGGGAVGGGHGRGGAAIPADGAHHHQQQQQQQHGAGDGNRVVINGVDIGAMLAEAAVAGSATRVPIGGDGEGDDGDGLSSTSPSTSSAINTDLNSDDDGPPEQAPLQQAEVMMGGTQQEGDDADAVAALVQLGYTAAEAAAILSGNPPPGMEGEFQFMDADGNILTAEEVARLTASGAATIQVADHLPLSDYDGMRGAVQGGDGAAINSRDADGDGDDAQSVSSGISDAVQASAGEEEDEGPNQSSQQSGKKKKKTKKSKAQQKEARYRNPLLEKSRAEWLAKLRKAHADQDEDEGPFEEAPSPHGGGDAASDASSSLMPVMRNKRALARYSAMLGRRVTPAEAMAMDQEEFGAFMARQREHMRRSNEKEEEDEDAAPSPSSAAPFTEASTSTVQQCIARLGRTGRIIKLSLGTHAEQEEEQGEGAGGSSALHNAGGALLVNPMPTSVGLLQQLRRRLQRDAGSDECRGLINTKGHGSDISDATAAPAVASRLYGELAATLERHFSAVRSFLSAGPLPVEAPSSSSSYIYTVPTVQAMHLCNHFFALTEETSVGVPRSLSSFPSSTVNAHTDAMRSRVPGTAAKAVASSRPTVAAMASVLYDPIVAAAVDDAALRDFVVGQRYLSECPQVMVASGNGAATTASASLSPYADPSFVDFVQEMLGELHYFASVLVVDGAVDGAEASAIAFLRLQQGSSAALASPRSSFMANRASTIAMGSLHDITVPSAARRSPSASSSAATVAGGIAPQSCVGLTSNTYRVGYLRRRMLGAPPRPFVIPSSSTKSQKKKMGAAASSAKKGDSDDGDDGGAVISSQFEAALSLLASGGGAGRPFASARRFVRGYDVRGLGVDAHFHNDRYASMINAWLGDGDQHTQGWIEEVGLPAWRRWAGERRDVVMADAPSAMLVAAAIEASCAAAGCSLMALQDYLVTAVGRIRQEHEGGGNGSPSSSSMPPPPVTVRTNYIDSLAQILYPIAHRPSSADDGGGADDATSAALLSDDMGTFVFQQALALATLDGGYYQDNDLRGMMRHAPIEGPVASGGADEDGFEGSGEGDGGYGEDEDYNEWVPSVDGDWPRDESSQHQRSTGQKQHDAMAHAMALKAHQHALTLEGGDGADSFEAVTSMGALTMLSRVPLATEEGEEGGSSSSSTTAPPTPPLVAAFARRGTSAEEFAGLYAKMEALLKLDGATVLAMNAAADGGGDAPPPPLPAPPLAAEDDATALREQAINAHVRSSVRYDVVRDSFVGVPIVERASAVTAKGKRKANANAGDESRLYGADELTELLESLQKANLVPLSAIPTLDGPDGSTTSTSSFPTDIALINSDLLLGLAAMYASGESDHIPKDADRAMCLAAAALSEMGYEDDQRSVLARVTYGEVAEGRGSDEPSSSSSSEGGGGPSPRTLLAIGAKAVRDDIFYVQKEVITGMDPSSSSSSPSHLGMSTGLYAVHDAIVGVALKQPLPMSDEEAVQHAAAGLKLSAMAQEPLDLGIHCRHRDLLHWRLADAVAGDRAFYHQVRREQRAAVLERSGAYKPSTVAAVMAALAPPNTDGNGAEIVANAEESESAHTSPLDVSDAEVLEVFNLLSAGDGEAVMMADGTVDPLPLSAVFAPTQHIFAAKHGMLSYEDLFTAATAKTVIMSVNMELATSMRAPVFEEDLAAPSGSGAPSASAPAIPTLTLPVARALYYGLSCMTLQGYAIEKHAKYYSLLNASGNVLGRGSGGHGDAPRTHQEEELLHPPPVPTVVAECAPLLASLFTNEALLPNAVMAQIVRRIGDTERAVDKAAEAAAAGMMADDEAAALFGGEAEAAADGTGVGGEAVGNGDDDNDDDDGGSLASHQRPFVNLFEEVAYEEAMREATAQQEALEASRYGSEQHIGSFADDNLFVHIPYWNLCMRRAVDDEEEDAAAKKTSMPQHQLSPITRCRRLIAYHLAALAAATHDGSSRNASTRLSPQGTLLSVLEETVRMKAVADDPYGGGRGGHGGAGGSSYNHQRPALRWAGAADDPPSPEEVVAGGGADAAAASPVDGMLDHYVGSDVWLLDELRRHDVNNEGAPQHAQQGGTHGHDRSAMRRQGAVQLALMHAAAAQEPWWLPEITEGGGDGFIPYHFDLQASVLGGGGSDDGNSNKALMPVGRHAASKYNSSRVGAQLFIAESAVSPAKGPTEGAPLDALKLIATRLTWAPIRGPSTPSSSSPTQQQYLMVMPYYHSIVDGMFDPFQVLTTGADGAVMAAPDDSSSSSRRQAANHPLSQQSMGRLAMARGNILDARYAKGSHRNGDPTSDDLADWVYDEGSSSSNGAGQHGMDAETRAALEAAGVGPSEFFFLGQAAGRDGGGVRYPPTRDYTSAGAWSRPYENSDVYTPTMGDDHLAVATALLLASYAQHSVATGALAGLVTSAEGAVPSAHPANPHGPYGPSAMVAKAHQEGACRITDMAHRLYADSTAPADGNGRRIMPDYETGGAGGTRVATMAKHYGRTRLGQRVQRDALMLLSDYAHVNEGFTAAAAAAHSMSDRDPLMGGSGSSRGGAVSGMASRVFLAPAVILFAGLDATVFALVRSALALVRGAYLAASYLWHAHVMRRWLWYQYTPSPRDEAAAREFIAAAGLQMPSLPPPSSSSSSPSSPSLDGAIEEAFAIHLDRYYEGTYGGLVESVSVERGAALAAAEEGVAQSEGEAAPPANRLLFQKVRFTSLTLGDVAKRAFAWRNVMQHGIVMRGGGVTSLWWSEGDEVSPPLSSTADGEGGSSFYGRIASCEVRDMGIVARSQPIAVPATNGTATAATAPAGGYVASSSGTIGSGAFAPMIGLVASFVADDKGVVPLWGGGGWILSALSAVVRTVGNIVTPAPMCDPYAKVQPATTGAADATATAVSSFSSASFSSSISAMPPAQRQLMNSLLKRVMLVKPFGASSPSVVASVTAPSPIVPYSERRGTLQHPSPLYESLPPLGGAGVGGSGHHGLHRSELRSWFGTRGISTAPAGVVASSRTLLLKVSTDDGTLHGGPAAAEEHGLLATVASTARKLWMLALFAPNMPWGGVCDEVFSWRWASAEEALGSIALRYGGGGVGVQTRANRDGLAVPYGAQTIPSSRPITVSRSWVGAGKAITDADAMDVPIYWHFGGGHTAQSGVEAQWEAKGVHGDSYSEGDDEGEAPITAFILSRYLPMVDVRAGIPALPLDEAERGIVAVRRHVLPSVVAPLPPTESSATSPTSTPEGWVERMLRLTQIGAFMTSTLPEDAIPLLQQAPAPLSEGASGALIPSAAAVNAAERDVWLHLGQYDVIARLPTRETMELETGGSSLFTSQHDDGGSSQSSSSLPHPLAVSHSPRDSGLRAMYDGHLAAAEASLANAARHTKAYRRHHTDRVAEERLSLSVGVSVEGGASAQCLISLATPLPMSIFADGSSSLSSSSAPAAQWAQSLLAEALLAHSEGIATTAAAAAAPSQQGAGAHSVEIIAPIRIDSSSSSSSSALASPSLVRRVWDRLYGLLGSLLGSEGIAVARELHFLSFLSAARSLPPTPPSLLVDSSDGGKKDVLLDTRVVQWAHVTATIPAPTTTTASSPSSSPYRFCEEALLHSSAEGGGVAALVAQLKESPPTTTASSSSPSFAISGVVAVDAHLPAAFHSLGDAFAHQWACSGLGTGLLYTGRAVATGRIMAKAKLQRTDRLAGDGDDDDDLYTVDLPQPLSSSDDAAAEGRGESGGESFYADGDTATVAWSPADFAVELRRYLSSAYMLPSSSPSSSFDQPPSYRSPFADAAYLFGDAKCVADMAWLIEAVEGEGGSDALFAATPSSPSSATSSASPPFALSAGIAIHATYKARGRGQGGGDGLVWQLERLAIARRRQGEDGRVLAEDASTPSSFADFFGVKNTSARHPNPISLPSLLSSLSLAVARSHERYEGTARYKTPPRALRAPASIDEWLLGPAPDRGEDGEEGADGIALDDEGGDIEARPEGRLRLGGDAYRGGGFEAPSHGLYRMPPTGGTLGGGSRSSEAARKPRPVFMDAATEEHVITTDDPIDGPRQMGAVDGTDPLMFRYRSASPSSVVYPPHASGFALVSDAEAAVASQDPRRPSMSWPHLVPEEEQQSDLRPAPAPWPPRLGEGRSFFGVRGVLRKQSAEGYVEASGWAQWWRSWWG